MARWTHFVLRHRIAVVVCVARRARARRLCELAALAAPLEHVHRSGHRLGAGAEGARASTSATARTARSRSSSRCRTRATPALLAPAPGGRRPRGHGRADRTADEAARRGSARRLRRRRLDPRPRAGEGLERRPPARRRQASRRRARLRHGCCVDPARARPDLQRGPAQGRDDRDPDRAARAARSVRDLGLGHDPVHLRRLHDHRHARDRLLDRPPRGDADVRDEPRAADRARDRRRLLAADRLPLPRGALRNGSREQGRRDRAHDGDSRALGGLLRASRSRSASRCSSRCRCRSCG